MTIAAPVSSLALVEEVRKGKVSAVARLISRAESAPEEASEALAEIHRHTRRAHIVGITGVPGSGKSTLIAQLCRKIRDSGRKVIDPLGGSYFLESLTSQYEKAIFEILDEVDARGGTVKLINDGWFQRRIADFAYELAIKKQEGDHPVVGVNCFVEDEEELDMELHPYDPTTADRQLARLSHVRATRDEAKVRGLLEQLKEIARDDGRNIMPVTIELVREGATMGDIVETLKTVWGTYRETPVF